MKRNFKNILLLCSGVLVSAVAPLKAAGTEQNTGKTGTSNIFTRNFTTIKGDFDEAAIKKAFDSLDYGKKAPLVVAIYEDAKKNGFTETHRDQLSELFFEKGSNEAKAMKNIKPEEFENFVKSLKKSDKVKDTKGPYTAAYFVIGGILVALSLSLRKKGLLTAPQLLVAASVLSGVVWEEAKYLEQEKNIRQILSSESEMRQFTTNYFKEVYKKAHQKQMPDAVKVHQIKKVRDR